MADSVWKKARKKPIVIEFREPKYEREIIRTLEGSLVAEKGRDLVIKGLRGELYPIKIDIFKETYEVLE